jgi:hypothetical protein
VQHLGKHLVTGESREPSDANSSLLSGLGEIL